MRKRLLTLLILSAVVFTWGCGKNNNGGQQTVSTDADTDASTEVTKPEKGVYYNWASKEDFLQNADPNSSACYAASLLYYDGKIYSASGDGIYTEAADSIETLQKEYHLGEKIADMKYNGAGYSTDESLLGAIDGDAGLYTVTGYDQAFTVATVQEESSADLNEGNIFVMQVFRLYNDIVLDKGSELYKDRLDFDKTAKIELKYLDGENESDIEKEIDTSGADVKEFINALYEGSFTEDATAVSDLQAYNFKFYDENGFKTEIYVYENGYVILCPSAFKDIALKMDAIKCKAFIDLALK